MTTHPQDPTPEDLLEAEEEAQRRADALTDAEFEAEIAAERAEDFAAEARYAAGMVAQEARDLAANRAEGICPAIYHGARSVGRCICLDTTAGR